jgi:hypothetical protein
MAPRALSTPRARFVIFAEDAGYKKDQLPDLYSRILERLNSAPGVSAMTISVSGFLYNGSA